jgi:KDO2-lipid IV(A) lauroyltransferase
MQLLAYLLVYPIIVLISILPFPILYKLSDFICFILYRIIGYRRKVVRENLALALPHLSDLERLDIEKKFYSHMCDIFLEMTKTRTMSQAEMEKRYKWTNIEVVKNLEKKGKSIALFMSHYGSYEWAVSMNKFIEFEGFAIYKKINNKYFDRLIHKIRSKHKATLLDSKQTINVVTENESNNKRGIYGFASDQSPQVKPKVYWTKFMGIEVPVHTGAEMLAKQFDMNVIYVRTRKVARGFYEGEFEVFSENVRSVPDYQLTDLFLKRTEEQILEKPEYYLWTHKRWKHAGKAH